MIFWLLAVLKASEANTWVVGGEGELHVQVDSAYHVIHYFANYKQLLIDLKVKENVEKILISDKLIENPADGCPESSLYCTWGDSKRIIETISVCVNDVYIHIFPSKVNDNVFLTVKTDYVKDTACNDIDRNPTNFCPLLDQKECLESCNTGCGLLTCQRKRSIQNTDIFHVCLKDSFSEDKLKNICDAHSEANTYKWKVCAEEESSSNWIVFIVVSLLITAIVYYQKMFQKFGRPPFRVPRCCPRKLFPRHDDEEAENLRVIQ
jgi:hypothetical protein